MKFLTIVFFLILSSCTLNKVQNHHGVHFLEKKNESLIVKKTNKNDIIKLLGQPSTESKFDNDLWIYIERKTDNSNFLTFSKEKILVNNVLLLEIDSKGLLKKKEFFDKNKMNDIKFTQETTVGLTKQNTFIYDFLSSMRQKINDPLGKRKKP